MRLKEKIAEKNKNRSTNSETKAYRFLEDGDIPISNNRAENAVGPFCVGRKNWLFSTSVKGVKASAMIYSVAATGGESVYCEDIKERIGPDNRTKEELDQIIAEMTEDHYPNSWFYEGKRIIYDDHYFLTGIVYPMEEYLTDTSE